MFKVMVKYSNRNNSAADCSISLKFATEFDHGTAGVLKIFKVKGQRSRSQRNVTYRQQKRPKKATDRLSGFKLSTRAGFTPSGAPVQKKCGAPII